MYLLVFSSKPTKKSESDVFGSSRLLTAGEVKRQKEQKKRQERKRGYCECCHVKYEDLDKVLCLTWPRGYKTFFMLSSTEREIFLLINVKMPNNCWNFNIYEWEK